MKNIPLPRRTRHNYNNNSRRTVEGLKREGVRAQLFALNRILMHSSRSFAARRVDYALCLTCVNKTGANSTTPENGVRRNSLSHSTLLYMPVLKNIVCYRSFKKSVSRLLEKANSRSALNSGIISWHLTLQRTVPSLVDKGEWLHLKFLREYDISLK